MCLFYVDDGTLGGSSQVRLHDLQLVEQGTAELGLSLNHGKSDVINIAHTAKLWPQI